MSDEITTCLKIPLTLRKKMWSIYIYINETAVQQLK